MINDDLVAAPKPVVAIADVIRGHAEIEAAEPEALRPASREMPDVGAAKTSLKMPVFPRVIEVIVRIAGRRIVSYPLSVCMDVGGVGMPRRIAKIRPLGNGLPLRRPRRSGVFRRAPVARGTMRGDVPVTNGMAVAASTLGVAASFFLGKGKRGKQQDCRESA